MFEVRACGKTNCPQSSEYNLSNSGILQTYSCERCLLAAVRMESVWCYVWLWNTDACTAPPTREDGKDCSGDFSEVRACEKTNCPRSREHKLKKST